MTEIVGEKVQKIQNVATLASALLTVLSAGSVLLSLPMPRNAHFALGLVLLVNGFILVWTIHRLRR